MNCKNCNHGLLDGSKFCNQCGAKIITTRLHFKKIISEWFSSILNIENNLIATLLHLFTKPQDVSIGYINGLRKRYMTPISFFLLSFGIYGFYTLVFEIQEYHSDFLFGFYNYDGNTIGEQKLQRLKILNLPIYFFQVLIFAFSLKLVFRNQFNYSENLIIAAYWFGQFLLTTVLFCFLVKAFNVDIIPEIQLVIFIFFVLYTLWNQKKIFQNSWLLHLVQLIGFLVISFIFYITFILFLSFIL